MQLISSDPISLTNNKRSNSRIFDEVDIKFNVIGLLVVSWWSLPRNRENIYFVQKSTDCEANTGPGLPLLSLGSLVFMVVGSSEETFYNESRMKHKWNVIFQLIFIL